MEQLLVKYPAAKKVVHDYYLEKMMNSLEKNNLPEEFEQFVKDVGITDDNLIGMLSGNPRSLFDVFDDNSILIAVNPINFNEWCVQINFKDYDNRFSSRLEAEKYAIREAFEKLESKLLEANLEN